jgi:hypothetical protein
VYLCKQKACRQQAVTVERMRKTVLMMLALIANLLALGQGRTDLEALYRQIDEAIAESPRYVAQREARITSARRAYELADDQQKYEAGFRLYELYRPFVSDSAIFFLRECIDRLSSKATTLPPYVAVPCWPSAVPTSVCTMRR